MQSVLCKILNPETGPPGSKPIRKRKRNAWLAIQAPRDVGAQMQTNSASDAVPGSHRWNFQGGGLINVSWLLCGLPEMPTLV
jgi:hypothetical protein